MPYLNWKEKAQDAAFRLEVVTHPRLENELRVSLSAQDRDELVSRLDEVLIQPSSAFAELRVDLPREWVLFFKRREDESRMLVAHPDENVWVATLGLETEHGRAFLRALVESKEVRVSELGPVSAVSNCELQITIR